MCRSGGKANRETGRTCLYVPHVSGPWKTMRARCLFAKKAGAGGVLICPGLTGFDALRDIARDEAIALPILSHPALLGSFFVNPDSGIAPSVIFGQLPRLAGADASIYPTFGLDFPMSREDCRQIALETGTPWSRLKPVFPTAAGRMSVERVSEMYMLYKNDLIFILGSSIQRRDGNLVHACQQFVDEVARCTQST